MQFQKIERPSYIDIHQCKADDIDRKPTVIAQSDHHIVYLRDISDDVAAYVDILILNIFNGVAKNIGIENPDRLAGKPDWIIEKGWLDGLKNLYNKWKMTIGRSGPSPYKPFTIKGRQLYKYKKDKSGRLKIDIPMTQREWDEFEKQVTTYLKPYLSTLAEEMAVKGMLLGMASLESEYQGKDPLDYGKKSFEQIEKERFDGYIPDKVESMKKRYRTSRSTERVIKDVMDRITAQYITGIDEKVRSTIKGQIINAYKLGKSPRELASDLYWMKDDKKEFQEYKKEIEANKEWIKEYRQKHQDSFATLTGRIQQMTEEKKDLEAKPEATKDEKKYIRKLDSLINKDIRTIQKLNKPIDNASAHQLIRDWHRVAMYETSMLHETAKLAEHEETAFESLSEDSKAVYFIYGYGTCDWCLEHNGTLVRYIPSIIVGDTSNDSLSIRGIKDPYTDIAIWAGKNNIGFKQREWRVCVPAHPFNRATFHRIDPGTEKVDVPMRVIIPKAGTDGEERWKKYVPQKYLEQHEKNRSEAIARQEKQTWDRRKGLFKENKEYYDNVVWGPKSDTRAAWRTASGEVGSVDVGNIARLGLEE